jgi:ankyrin repeat protein
MKFLWFLVLIQFGFVQTTIFEVARHGTVDELKILVESSPDLLNSVDQRGSSPLLLACYYNNVEVAKYLVHHVNDINGITKDGSPLMAASVKGHNEIAKILLVAGADVSAEDTNQTTALHYAVMFKNFELAQLLLDAGADPNHNNHIGQSPMDFALMLNNDQMNQIFNIK